MSSLFVYLNEIMKAALLTIFFLVFTIGISAQTSPVSRILSAAESNAIFTTAIKTQFRISFPIRRVYEYSDRSGRFLLVVSESIDTIIPKKDTLHHQIKAVSLAYTAAGLEKRWELTDMIKKGEAADHPENSIWFWTKFFQLKDLDNDGLIDPILVYGSSGEDADDGRVRIMTYYKGQKIALRHQEGTLDEERNTAVDQAFYTMPLNIQAAVRKLMTELEVSLVNFPYGWEKAMDRKKTYIDEN
jgi:hypothetical protein